MLAVAFAPLRARDFRLLLGARTASLLGTAMAPVGLAFAVLHATGRVGDLGLVLAAQSAAMLVLLPVGGVVADRRPRRQVLITADCVSALAQSATTGVVLAGSRSIVLLAGLQAFVGASRAFAAPALTGLVPQTVPAQVRQQGNALVGLTRNITGLLGGPLAGLLAVLFGPPAALAVDAGSYAVSASCWFRLRVVVGGSGGGGMLTELREGWTEFRSRTWLWAIVVQFAVLVGFGVAAFDVLGPVVARDRLGGASSFGIVLGAEALGAVAAGLLGLRVRFRRPLLVGTYGTLLLVPELLLLAWSSSLAAISVSAAAAGAGMGLFGVLWETALQDLVPPDALSRVSSYDALGSFVLLPVGLALMGPLVGAVGVPSALVTGAVGVLVPTLGVLAVRDVRRPIDELHAARVPIPT